MNQIIFRVESAGKVKKNRFFCLLSWKITVGGFVNEHINNSGPGNKFLLAVLQVMYPISWTTVLPAKSDSDVMFCLQSYQRLRIDRSHVY